MQFDPFGLGLEFQRIGDWFEQRKSYRQAALNALRKREGLSSPVDAEGVPLETRFDDQGSAHYYDQFGNKVDHVLFANTGRDGKPGSFAVGARKGEALRDAEANWGTTPVEDLPLHLQRDERARQFEILEVAEDGRKLTDELLDLNRDSATYERAERVSHGDASEQAPELVLDGTSDAEVDQKLQEYLKRGKNV